MDQKWVWGRSKAGKIKWDKTSSQAKEILPLKFIRMLFCI